MRNPNGYGSVVKLSGNRRKPYAVRKTKGWNEKGHPIYESIGYATTREEGMILLAEYNKTPWNVADGKMTVNELFEKWKEVKLPKLKKSTGASLQSAYKYAKPLFNLNYSQIRSFHIQDLVDNCGKSPATQRSIRNIFRHLDNLALELDIINKGYSHLVTTESEPESSKEPFTDDEVDILWIHKDEPWVDSVLILMYTGFRIGEILDMKCANVDLVMGTFKGGSKTAAGKNRIVPIHSKIFEMVKKRKEEGHEYLFSHDGSKLPPTKYYRRWYTIMDAHGMHHTPHECRHTFRSRLDSAGANTVCIDRIMGHVSSGTGEKIYTHKTIEELRTAIELVTH